MKCFRTVLFVLCAGVAGLAQAQLLDSEMPAVDYLPMIFLNQKVAADMHLSSAVAEKERSIMISEGMAMLPAIQNSKGANPTQVKQQMLKALVKMENDSLAPLNAAQKLRYHQLTLQYVGPPALLTPKVAAQLGITASQKSKLQAAFHQANLSMMSQTRSMQKSASTDPMGAMRTMRTAQNSARSKEEQVAKSVLTSGQWSKWSALQGKKLPGIQDLFGGLGA